MFDADDLPVLTFGNCVLVKPGVIKWPMKLYVRFSMFLRFFQDPKRHDFLRSLSCYTRFLEH